MAALVKLQQQQLESSLRQSALSQLKEMRPEKKFSGTSSKRMDFEKHVKDFEDVAEIPGVTKRQMLNEFQHWFEGAAFKLIEAETMKRTATAVDDALATLKEKFENDRKRPWSCSTRRCKERPSTPRITMVCWTSTPS